jgi:hypothetical protein
VPEFAKKERLKHACLVGHAINDNFYELWINVFIKVYLKVHPSSIGNKSMRLYVGFKVEISRDQSRSCDD